MYVCMYAYMVVRVRDPFQSASKPFCVLFVLYFISFFLIFILFSFIYFFSLEAIEAIQF